MKKIGMICFGELGGVGDQLQLRKNDNKVGRKDKVDRGLTTLSDVQKGRLEEETHHNLLQGRLEEETYYNL